MKYGLGLYWETIRHLKPRQVFGRVQFNLTRPRIDDRPPPPRRPVRRGAWIPPAQREQSLVGDHRFRFLSTTIEIGKNGWDDPTLDRLWRYNLHYFDDLNANGGAARAREHRTLLQEWVAKKPPGVGTGWEPYPTSLRIVNWIKWALLGNALPDECLPSLAIQSRWLTKRLEVHLLGNHLFANAKALVFAGLFFEGREAQGWLERGMSILSEEVPEQILSDGGQFERSPMYHALALEDMLDLCNITTTYAGAIPVQHGSSLHQWSSTVDPMRRWLAAMCHPDGDIGFFNDAAIGTAPGPAELERYAAQLGFTSPCGPSDDVTLLPDSGYVRLQRGPAVALLDVGPVGPPYLPGHAHADTLSFELSVFGQRVLVNSGTSTYATGAERDRQRGTAAHNTVIVDGHDSSEVWAGFRVARRAQPSVVEIARDDGVSVCCSHDGYRRLPGKPVHHRQWHYDERSLTVEDNVSGAFETAFARYHLHPDVKPETGTNNGTGNLVLPSGHTVTWRVETGEPRLEPASSHPRFGLSVPTSCLSVRLADRRSRVRFEWA